MPQHCSISGKDFIASQHSRAVQHALDHLVHSSLVSIGDGTTSLMRVMVYCVDRCEYRGEQGQEDDFAQGCGQAHRGAKDQGQSQDKVVS